MWKKRVTTINKLLAAILIIGIVTIIGFTADQMGIFTGEPEIETQAEYTGGDVPELRIATDYEFCPNAYFNSKNELSGLYIEIMTEVANRLKMQPVFVTDDWPGCREQLENGDVDVLLGLEIFSNMEGTLRTIPISSDELCVYGKNKVYSAAALSGKKVALMARSVIISTFDLQCEYVEYNTNTEILEAVENGKVDYGICHAAVAEKLMEKNHLHLKKGTAIMKSFPALAVKDSNPELQEKLNTALQNMAEEGELYKLKTKWIDDFTKDRSLGHILKSNQAFYIVAFMSLLFVIVIAAAVQVNARNQEEHIRELLDYQEKLQISNQRTERANRAKTEFLTHMSHDIRTPMNGIMGMVEIIRKNISDVNRVVQCLNNIDAASSHLLSLINDVLDMSKLESGEIELEQAAFSLDKELEHIHMIVDNKAQEQQIDLTIQDQNVQHRYLIGSPGHLRRILLNLLSNALKYTPSKGKIMVDVTEISEDTKKAVLELRVQDSGIGMSREFVENSLYKPFTQENDTARTKYKGTGLGMAIVHKLVEIMDGTIEVESKPGKGTTFIITLPFEIGEASEISVQEEKKEKDIRGMKILLVEDNLLNREIAEYVLEEAGAEIVCAEDGRQAVEQFAASAEGRFDAILMDIMMPVLDGLEATREIRRMQRSDAATVPIIAMTANAFAEDKKKSADAGMNEHLTKPLDSEKLIETLSRYYQKEKGHE